MTDGHGPEEAPAFRLSARGGKVSDRVADALAALIAAGTVGAGARLPAERTLCERFGVSRTAVREAVRSLEARGLVTTRRGGGTRVTPDASRPGAALAALVAGTMRPALPGEASASTWPHLLEARRALEVEIAGLAAERHTPEDLGALEAALDDQRAGGDHEEAWAAADLRFHATLAVAAHSPYLPVLLTALQEPLLTARRQAYRLPHTPSVALRHHLRIYREVEQRDVAGARSAMLEHLKEAAATLRRVEQALVAAEPPAGGAAPAGGATPP